MQLLPLLSLLPSALSLALPASTAAAASNFLFLLAGDSTTATNGGWGDGFLNTTLQDGSTGINYGHSGATTASFRAGGDWDEVLASAKEGVAAGSEVWVTVQFGHNDQKSGSGVSLDDYTANLERFVAEVGDVGAHALLVTPLSRRNFDSADPPQVKEDLTEQRDATLSVASNTDTPSIDLNQASVDYLNAIGPDDAHTYNLDGTDNTHLNDAGGVVFANMVSWLMGKSVSDLSLGTQPNADYATNFENGEYFLPDV